MVKKFVKKNFSDRPTSQGLYDANLEHDSCGIGFVANIRGNKDHSIIQDGLKILENLTHRGAVGADPTMGDGAGLLLQIPDLFLRQECKSLGINLPEEGKYAVAQIFMAAEPDKQKYCEKILEDLISTSDEKFLGWRNVPVSEKAVSSSVNSSAPIIKQAFVAASEKNFNQDAFERRIYVLRKQFSNKLRDDEASGRQNILYVCSFSSRTLNYKGMLLSDTVGNYFPDLQDKRVVSALALVHQRFSTNTFPSWDLAQPFRMICHNGEINTLRGNVNWMNARKHIMTSKMLNDDLKKIWPVIAEGQSDSACFDNALELLVMGGYSLAHAMMLLIPESWKDNKLMDKNRRAFYEYNSSIMEPWDGPAAVAFTDGKQIGATLDRNGLRPARYFVTKDDKIILSSEMGVLPYPEDQIKEKWRLQPGRMLLIDLQKGSIITDEEVKKSLIEKHPYVSIVDQNRVKLDDLRKVEHEELNLSKKDKLDVQQAFGYTQEDIKFLIEPMINSAQEATGSMGTDTPLAVLSSKHKLLYNFFKQLFAQVTNPAIDPIREKMVMSLMSILGPRKNLLSVEPVNSKCLMLDQPILSNNEINLIKNIEKSDIGYKSFMLDATSVKQEGLSGMKKTIERLKSNSEKAIIDGCNIIIISDRNISKDRYAIPMLLALSSVHQHLVRTGLRTKIGIAIETGEAREIHHYCVLAGYGADAINPYLAFETIKDLINAPSVSVSYEEACKNYVQAIGKGILKVMSKMGISTYQSYNGAQIFDAVGLSNDFVNEYFPGTPSKIEGLSIEDILTSTIECHARAYGQEPILENMLDVGGDYAYRLRGEDHVWTPTSVRDLQHAVRGKSQEKYDEYARAINEQAIQKMTPRGMFELNFAKEPLNIDEIESAENIVKRFATGAMSFGSISREAHTNLAIAMNRIGGKSNTGEGGEETDRFNPMDNGDSMRSAIKQVASGRFGVTAEYLSNSDMIQIKMAQGAKPGEGGQLPGHKVDETIAKVRYSTPGVGLISPPPHHDIYSIEDLAQLIYDLKNSNPEAAISVKLVSEVGVGTVAAGVSKAKADHVTISGFEGGTGASPLTSIKHAGSPWEIGLAETHQTLVLNGLRSRIAVQVDGGLRTGRDVVVGALLGADEFGFSTAPLIASGCIMMRKCHLNTCPVGIATQDKELRKLFNGQPEHVVNYFFFVAEEVRKIMAELGFKDFNDMIGQSEVLETNQAIKHWKAEGLDFKNLFFKAKSWEGEDNFNSKEQDHNIYEILDREFIDKAKKAINNQKPIQIQSDIKNTDRSTGTMLSHEVAKKYGHAGLAHDTINIQLKGTAGQSFGAFLAKGVTLDLEGEANDYVGKGLSGGRIAIRPSLVSSIIPEESMIVGNTVLYGAIEGECYFRGIAGERFAVRNSGATALVEGAGDHCCEYMTGGIVVVIGDVGRNFGAGMSGGIAYILDPNDQLQDLYNPEMIELETITEDNNINNDKLLDNHLFNDMNRLNKLIKNHLHYTNSKKASEILDNFSNYLPLFKKVMPVEYKKVLIQNFEKKQEEERA